MHAHAYPVPGAALTLILIAALCLAGCVSSSSSPTPGNLPGTDRTADYGSNTCPTGCHDDGDDGTRHAGCNGILLFRTGVSGHTELFLYPCIDNGDPRDHRDVDEPGPCRSYGHLGSTIARDTQFAPTASGRYVPVHVQPDREVHVPMHHPSVHERNGDGSPVKQIFFMVFWEVPLHHSMNL